MLFNSFQFLIFFPVVTFLYFLIPHKWRWLHLLIASCVFYMAFIPVYILILFFTIIIDYIAGIMIGNAEGKKKKAYLALSIIANVGVLAIFKYYNFFISNINDLLHNLNIQIHDLPYLNILLPIGLSFHTFQAMSYTIEVYRGNQKPERHFGIYALYVMFYPQLVAGPIERPQNMLHQFHEKHEFDLTNISSGLKTMLWGFFMKLVVADRLALYVNSVYNNVDQHNGPTLILATLFFSFQIYCDFAGYSLIAIGSAKTMGFNLMTNFRRPYFSKSISEFWSRWHISLSTWFRDYLYISLGGSRVSIPRWYFNLFFVFLVSGFWHGANWTFVIWGALNGFYLIFAAMTQKWRESVNHTIRLDRVPWLMNVIRVITTFLLCAFAWIFFRANNVSDAFTIVEKIFTTPGKIFVTPGNKSIFIYGVFGLTLLWLYEYKKEFFDGKFPVLTNRKIYVRYISYIALVAIILLFGVLDGGQFIYFQF
ncbi:MAG: rane-bound O-acyltransferase family protein [Chitinophagaceae bacterium]|nr:rane-bound O-acyltransferase family protein [Chitinophagaceae bacterium]